MSFENADWYALAQAEIGTREGAGAKDNPVVLAYYADAGHPEIQHDAVAWCAAFACAMLERAGHPSPRTLSARDFMRWGKPLQQPQVGAVAVLTRGDPSSWQGHVGFLVKWDANSVWLLGGNQGDAVSVAKFDRGRVLGFREPVTLDNSRTVSAAKAIAASAAVATVAKTAEQVVPSPDTLSQMVDAGNAVAQALAPFVDALPIVGVAASLLTVVLAGVTLWARVDDLRNKGR